jgi:alpha-glucosidase
MFLAACGLASRGFAESPREVAVQSPDGKNRLELRVADDGTIQYTVERNGRFVVEPSRMDVRLAEFGSLAAGATIAESHQWQIDESSELPWGKTRVLRDHCNAASARLTGASGIAWDIELRAYDDGVAFRYGIPKQEKLRDFVIEEEVSEFRLTDNPTVLFMQLDGFNTSH